MASHKVKRATEDIKRELSVLLRDLKDPRITGMISIMDVILSPDYSHATVYVSSLEGIDSANEAVKGLENAAGFLRRELSARLRMRKIPSLHFKADDGIAYSASIGKIIHDLKNEEGKNEEGINNEE